MYVSGKGVQIYLLSVLAVISRVDKDMEASVTGGDVCRHMRWEVWLTVCSVQPGTGLLFSIVCILPSL